MKILDTNVLIDLDRHPEDFKEKIEKLESENVLCISSVTVFELWWGAYYSHIKKKKRENLKEEFDEFLTPFVIIDIDSNVAVAASTMSVDLQLIGKTIDLHDLYIAATTKILGVPLITNNLKHFEDIKDIQIIKWPNLD